MIWHAMPDVLLCCWRLCSFAEKVQQMLGPGRVLHHVKDHLRHSWATLPTPSMRPRQQGVVVCFIAAEHAAMVAAAAAAAAAAGAQQR